MTTSFAAIFDEEYQEERRQEQINARLTRAIVSRRWFKSCGVGNDAIRDARIIAFSGRSARKRLEVISAVTIQLTESCETTLIKQGQFL